MILIAQAVGKVGCADIKEPFFICHRSAPTKTLILFALPHLSLINNNARFRIMTIDLYVKL